MNSESNTVDDDGDSATKRVLDYYKKYSLNKDLPKYFSGTSVSYLPEIKDEFEYPEIVIKVTDVDIVINEENKDVNEELLDTSRASSVMSNRKLEWDNGADIGYDNCLDIKMLRKSSSLPLLTELKQNRVDLRRIMSNMEQQESQSSSDSNVKIVVLAGSSSSECPSVEIDNVYYSSSSAQPEEKKITSSSSSNGESNVLSKDIGTSSSSSDSSSKLRISQFANTLLYLKKKIGMPDAHSTPKYPECRKSDPALFLDTPVAKKCDDFGKSEVKPSTSKSEETLPLMQLQLKCADKQSISNAISLENLPVVDREEVEDSQGKNDVRVVREEHVLKYTNKKVINLAITTPMTVECVYSSPKYEQKSKDPPEQTVKKYTTIGVQTESITEQELIEAVKIQKQIDRNQSVLFFEYSESDGTNARSTQTGSDIVASNCDSFEFFKHSPEGKNDLPISNIHIEVGHKLLSKQPENKIDLTSVVQHQASILRRSQRTEDLRTVPSEDISHASSGDFCLGNVVSASQLDNIGDDIEKSINLLQKLLKSKKYDPATKKRYIKKIVKKLTESKYLEESSTSSDLFFPKKSKTSNLLPAKLPSLMASDSSDGIAKNSELKLPESSTDSTDEKISKNTLQSNLPWGPASSERVKLSPRKKKLVFKTFTQDFLPKQNQSSRDEVSSPPEIIPTDSRDTRKNCFTLTNNEFSVKHKSDETQMNRSSCETYKTSLEKQYESTSTSKSVSYENWREDKTLSEKLLEEQSVGNGNGDCLVQFAERERKYQINWINNEISHLGKLKGLLEKHESEPNVKRTTTVYTVSGESDNSSKKAKKSKHKFVIETHLGANAASDICYKIGDKKYTVHNSNQRKLSPSKKNGLELGVVDVVAGDSTTNIKIVTFCKSCKRAPCICVIKKSKICQVCKKSPCICPSSSSKRMATSGFENRSICRKCKKVYNSPSTESMLSGTTICIDCHKASCTCMKTVCGPNSDFKESSMHERYYCYNTGEVLLNTSPSDEYAGTFIPANQPKSLLDRSDTKSLTFPYTAKERTRKNVIFKSANTCSNCGGAPCVCHLKKDFVSSTISKVLPSGDIQNGSLKKVFENCSCTSKSNCHCGFVQKLIKHFDIAEIPTSILKDLNYYDKNCQTEEKPICHCQNVGVQVEMAEPQKLQTVDTSCDVRNKISQTEECPAYCNNGHAGIQAHVSMKNQICQKSECKLEQHTVSHYCQPSQVMFQYQETQTALVNYSSGEENGKKDVVKSAEKSTGSTTKLGVENSSEKKEEEGKEVVACTCASTQVDSDLLQTSSSGATSSCKCSKCRNNTKKHIKCIGKHTVTSINNTEQCKSDSLESNARYENSSSAVVSSYVELSESCTEESTSKTPTVICVCCKEQHTPENVVMQESFNQSYPLCRYCIHRRPILTSHCYARPHHVCTCYSKPVRADLLQEIKNTVDELHGLEHCTCINSGQMKNQPILYCKYCQFKLAQTKKNKKGIAYTLTLENESPGKVKCKRKKKKPPLEEIRIKVPCSYNRKKYKDKENFCRKDCAKEKIQVCSDAAINTNYPKDDKTKTLGKTLKIRSLTLQEHLRKNRPDFIDSAEYRRQTVLASRNERELNKDEVKLRFLDESIKNNKLKKQKLFTEKEMKDITKRNYKKLPEIRQQVNKVKEQKLRFADRFIADVFTRKVRGSVLKGKKTFPIDRNIVTFPKT